MNAIASRSLPQVLHDAHAAAERLAVATRSWSVFEPSTVALEEVSNVAEGFRRTLLELRPHAAQLKAPRSA
jgi:hypothetical protein